MKTLPKTYRARLKERVPLAVEDYWEFRNLGPRHTPASCAKWIQSNLFMGFTDREWEMWGPQLIEASYDLVQEYYALHKPEYPEADPQNEFCPRFLAWQEHLRTEYDLSEGVVKITARYVRARMWDGEPFEQATGEYERLIKAVLNRDD